MRELLFVLLWMMAACATAQELYVSTEPASNMAAHSIGLRLADRTWYPQGRARSRITPEIMVGMTKNLMVHLEGSFADYYTSDLRAESINLYAKYRLISKDAVQTHFRMAAYSRIAYSRNAGPYDDLNLEGDMSGFAAGLVGTQLLHKLALSATAGINKAADLREGAAWLRGEAYNYSLSAGYLLLPVHYTSYDQVNVNLYLELLGKKNPALSGHSIALLNAGNSVTLAPAIQLIFSSQTRVDIGFRFDVHNTGTEMGTMGIVRLEYNLFNVW